MKRLILIAALALPVAIYGASRVLVIDSTSKESAPIDAKLRVDTVVATGAITAESFSSESDGSNGGGVAYKDADGSNHVRHQAPATVTSDSNYIWPASPSSGYFYGTASGTNVTISARAKQEAVFVLTVEDVADSMNYAIGFVGSAFTITEIRAVHVGSGLSSPSISLTVNHGTDRTSGTAAVTGGSTITSTTTGDSVESFNDATVVADSWLWITTASKSGTTDNLEVIVRGAYD